MSAPKIDIIEVPKDYVPAKGETVIVVFRPNAFHDALYGHGLTNSQAVAALDRIKKYIGDKYGDSYTVTGLDVVPVNGEFIDELHVHVTATGTPVILVLVGIAIIGATFAVISDRVYKTVDAVPAAATAAVGLGGIALLLALVVLPKYIPGLRR